MLIEFWNPWCQHCVAFKPIWAQITNLTAFNIVYADINCVKNKAFSKKFPVDGYPQVLYYDTVRNEFIQYGGLMTVDAIESFIYKQINFPIIFLNGEDNLNYYRQLTNISSLFLMKLPAKSGNYTTSFRSLAVKYRNSSSTFAVINSDSIELSVYKSYNKIILYEFSRPILLLIENEFELFIDS